MQPAPAKSDARTRASSHAAETPVSATHEWTHHGQLPEVSGELEDGIYSTKNPKIDVQNVSVPVMRSYMQHLRLGTLTKQKLSGCSRPDLHASAGARTVDPDAPVDNDIFLGVVTFHPDGTFDVTGQPSPSEMPSPADQMCLNMYTGLPQPIRDDTCDIKIKPHHDQSLNCKLRNSVFAPSAGTGVLPKTTDVVPPDLRPAPKTDSALPSSKSNRGRSSSSISNKKVQQKGGRKRRSAVKINTQRRTFSCVVSQGKQEYILEGQYPIDEKLIDASAPEIADWVDRLLSQQIEKFTCMDEITRWEPLPSDPLLRITLKKDCRPPARRYPVPIHMYPEFKEFIKTMLEKNFIVPSTSSFSAPILIIKKPPDASGKSRGWRLVTDFRSLNQCIDPPQYYQPDVQTMYEKLRGAKYISTFDMKNGYWNAGIHPDDVDYLAFSSPWGTFAYQVLPQGLISSAAHFQNWVEQKLRKHGVLLEYAPFEPQTPSNTVTSDISAQLSKYPTAKTSQTGTHPAGAMSQTVRKLLTDNRHALHRAFNDSTFDTPEDAIEHVLRTLRKYGYHTDEDLRHEQQRPTSLQLNHVFLSQNEGLRYLNRNIPDFLRSIVINCDMTDNGHGDILSEILDDNEPADDNVPPPPLQTSDPHQLTRSEGFVAAYADDLICVSNSLEEHKRHLVLLLRIMSAERIFLQTSKSHVGCKYVRYLGAVAGNNMLFQDPEKIRAIVAMPMPKNSQTEIRGFLGMCSFWRRWISSYSKLAQPLNELLKKGVNVRTAWSDVHDAAVIALKRALISYPVLRQFDPARESKVITDASDYACGGLLAQKHDDKWCAVAFASRSFTRKPNAITPSKRRNAWVSYIACRNSGTTSCAPNSS